MNENFKTLVQIMLWVVFIFGIIFSSWIWVFGSLGAITITALDSSIKKEVLK